MNYNQLTEEERYQVYAYMKAGFTQKAIAQQLNRHASTICREVGRNQGLKGYRPKQAHSLSEQRRSMAHKYCKLTGNVKQQIHQLLAQDLSPEQIAGYLSKMKIVDLSHETIYRYIYTDQLAGGQLYLRLRHIPKGYRKRYGSYQKRGQILDRVSIEARPAIVERKTRLGDWEGDTIIGKGRTSALLTLVERKSLYTVIIKLADRSASGLADKLTNAMQPCADLFKTLTVDNGKEFAQHKRIAKSLNAKVYFAHPYSSWERGINENTNGLIRQYFPKGTDFNQVTDQQIKQVMQRLNYRPRKTRDYKTPHEVFLGQTVDLLAA